MEKLIIPKSARIAWNTIADTTMERDDQESIFLATFDDVPTANRAKYQIDYSYYNRGKYEAAPKFMLHVYTCGVDFENYSDTINHLDKTYDTLDGGIEDINHWLSVFDKRKISTLSLNIVLRKDTPQYILDFFQKGIKNDEIPSVLYDYGFTFDNQPRFLAGTTLFCEERYERFHLSIFHRFDFETEADKGYWFVGGLAQFAENNPMAGYVTHADGNTQLFAFYEKQCFFLNDLKVVIDPKQLK